MTASRTSSPARSPGSSAGYDRELNGATPQATLPHACARPLFGGEVADDARGGRAGAGVRRVDHERQRLARTSLDRDRRLEVAVAVGDHFAANAVDAIAAA